MLILFVTVSLFCINVMFGYAESMYYNQLNATVYSTVTFSNMDGKTKAEDLLKRAREITEYKVGSVLYFKELENMSTLIGWDGTEDTRRWGSHIAGRRFTNEEMENGENVIYVHWHDYEDKSLSIGDSITVDKIDYSIIGMGFLHSSVFLDAVGSDSTQTVIGQDLAQHSKKRQSYMMVPYKGFRKNGYEPDVVLLHFVDINHSQYLKAYEKLKIEFPNCEITASNNSSDFNRLFLAVAWAPFGFILAFAIGISLANIMSIWISEQRQIVYVYQICGLSKRRIRAYSVLEIFVISVIGEVISLLTQLLFKVPLSIIFVERMPNILEILITVAISFVLLSLVARKQIRKNLIFQGGIGE